MNVTWAMFRRALDKDAKWEFCGMTSHDEKVTEFEEMNAEEYEMVVISLEGQ
jgi:hypothetical protein